MFCFFSFKGFNTYFPISCGIPTTTTFTVTITKIQIPSCEVLEKEKKYYFTTTTTLQVIFNNFTRVNFTSSPCFAPYSQPPTPLKISSLVRVLNLYSIFLAFCLPFVISQLFYIHSFNFFKENNRGLLFYRFNLSGGGKFSVLETWSLEKNFTFKINEI